jgi:hypothetical protein
MPEKHIVKHAHQQSYPTAIRLQAGERVPFTKRDMWDGQYEWLWCVHPAGDAGWVPAEWLVVDGDYATAQHDYHAIELTVSADEIVAVHKTVAGWHWCENQDGQFGWVPVSCFDT